MPVLAEALAPLTEARGHSKPHVGSSTGGLSPVDFPEPFPAPLTSASASRQMAHPPMMPVE